MTRFAVLLGLGAMLAASTYAQQPTDDHFTGKTTVMDGKELSAARRRFEPGARAAWHSHDNGQLLLVEDGRMRTQKKGGPVKDLGKGESDYTGPRIIHWHGATPTEPLVQINVGFGGETRWMEKVTDTEYAKK